MKTLLLNTLTAGLITALVACHPSTPEKESATTPKAGGPPRVFAANYPLQYFAQRIAGNEVEVSFPCPKDADPAFWQPTDDEITAIQNSDLILLNGATFSKWAEKVTLPEAKVVDTALAFKDQFIIIKNAVTHSHGKQGMHSHDGISFTTWIDFQQAILHATAVLEALKKLKPEKADLFAKNFAALKEDLLGLDTRMLVVGKTLGNKPMVASHPIFQYWARRYGINLQTVLWEPDEVPTDEQMDGLKKILAEHPAKWMVWEREPAKGAADKISAVGLGSVAFDPYSNSNMPEQGDFMAVMRQNVTNMETMAAK